MKLLAVIPARGGSKGIPHKNIIPLCGKPLLEYTIEALLAAQVENVDIAVSTDAPEIADVARKYPTVHVVDRPKELSVDTASTESALLHALHVMEEKLDTSYDAIITLQPTSPLRKPETIRRFIEAFQKDCTHDAMLSLHENREDHWVWNGEEYRRLYPDAPRRRQERAPLYIENSMLYITRVSALNATNSILGVNPTGFVVDEIEGIDINSFVDLERAKFYIESRGVSV